MALEQLVIIPERQGEKKLRCRLPNLSVADYRKCMGASEGHGGEVSGAGGRGGFIQNVINENMYFHLHANLG